MLKKIAVLTTIATLTLNNLFAQERDFRKEKAELARQEREAKKKDKSYERSSYGTNIISISPLSALDIGIGVGASYEKILGADQNIGIVIPVHLMFEQNNDYYYNGYYGYNSNHYNSYFYFTPGIKIYPFGQRKVTYAVGPNLMMGAGGGKQWATDNNGNNYQVTTNKFRFGMLVNNYVNFQFSKSFNMNIQAGLGVRYIDHESESDYINGKDSYSNGMNVTGEFAVSLGYRF